MRAAPIYSEPELLQYGIQLGKSLKSGDRVLLEGPMGVGKSTLARAILEGMGISHGIEGSPSFPIAHEYRDREGRRVLHADFYRLKSETEIEETGLMEVFWDETTIILSEWTKQFEDFYRSLKKTGHLNVIEVNLDFDSDPKRRILKA